MTRRIATDKHGRPQDAPWRGRREKEGTGGCVSAYLSCCRGRGGKVGPRKDRECTRVEGEADPERSRRGSVRRWGRAGQHGELDRGLAM